MTIMQVIWWKPMEKVFFWPSAIILKGANAVSNSWALLGAEFSYRVGTGTSVRAPNITACCSRTKAMKGLSRKSTSPTSTLEASASRGNFFMNLFFNCISKREWKIEWRLLAMQTEMYNKIYPVQPHFLLGHRTWTYFWPVSVIPMLSTKAETNALLLTVDLSPLYM